MFMHRCRRAALAVLLAIVGCGSEPRPIEVADSTVIVQNLTSRDWRNVVVTVNDHFRGGASVLAAHGRLTAPLSQFQTGFGQRFDIAHQNVFKVEVTATDSSGEAVKLDYGGDRKKP
jgi:hypothetical protein